MWKKSKSHIPVSPWPFFNLPLKKKRSLLIFACANMSGLINYVWHEEKTVYVLVLAEFLVSTCLKPASVFSPLKVLNLYMRPTLPIKPQWGLRALVKCSYIYGKNEEPTFNGG